MRSRGNRKHHLEQLSLFEEQPKRPRWIELPTHVQRRVSDLIALMLVESLRTNPLPPEHKEVADER